MESVPLSVYVTDNSGIVRMDGGLSVRQGNRNMVCRPDDCQHLEGVDVYMSLLIRSYPRVQVVSYVTVPSQIGCHPKFWILDWIVKMEIP